MFDATVSAQTPENADVIDLVACMPVSNVLSGSLTPCLVDASEFIAGHLNRSSMHVTQSVVHTEAAAESGAACEGCTRYLSMLQAIDVAFQKTEHN